MRERTCVREEEEEEEKGRGEGGANCATTIKSGQKKGKEEVEMAVAAST